MCLSHTLSGTDCTEDSLCRDTEASSLIKANSSSKGRHQEIRRTSKGSELGNRQSSESKQQNRMMQRGNSQKIQCWTTRRELDGQSDKAGRDEVDNQTEVRHVREEEAITQEEKRLDRT